MSTRHRLPEYHAKPYSYSHSHDSVAGLQVIQYRSYQRDIHIYHLRTHLLPLPVVRKALQSQEGYRDRLTSYDPLRYFDVIEGDEVPPGCIEAAYMPNIIRGYGSALALRAAGDLDSEAVEWYVFSGPIDGSFLSQFVCADGKWGLQLENSSDDPRKVFDLVGYVEKGLKTRTVRGANREHKGWHDTLCASKPVKKKVKLTWKRFGKELRADHERKSREATVGREEQEQDEGGQNVPMRDESKQPPQPPQKPVTRIKVLN
ncbi:uncharacterized protein M421DRAFT_2727 [Didymella exigua CBS 183.55]|uniref:Uncharacterized protein n=1 Tax=Didymella exigua CBS 183.55 TaxID=1150837 RepID=A0A6A5RV26_9PLEO|nr:uncharacterized protein M421DRAFT_2727 [Didymella exigua CBS 183.55]KAF1931210.1 hypothetical protein M421DRAFT_2727 [Didymella exigua CBS 183.55]